MELGLAGEGEGKGGRDPVLLACSRVLSSLPGRRQGHQQGRQSGQGAPAATVCTGGGHQGTTWLHLQGLQPGDPLLGPGSSGRCRCGLCSSPHRGLQTCWECKHRQPGCTSGCHLGGEADWPAACPGGPAQLPRRPRPVASRWQRGRELCSGMLLLPHPPQSGGFSAGNCYCVSPKSMSTWNMGVGPYLKVGSSQM